MDQYQSFDVLIAGAGVSGSAIARELSRTDLKTLVLEKEPDVCEGTSKANSGIVHAGYDAMPDTLKARLNVRGAELMPQLAEELQFEYRNNGSLVLCFQEEGRPALKDLLQRGLANGVPGLQILDRDQVLALEPNVDPDVVCALYAPTAGIVCPFGLNIALAENAADNGVRFRFEEPVVSLQPAEEGWLVNDRYLTRVFVNAAGLQADTIHNMACPDPIRIRPRRGEYFLLDKAAGSLASATLFQLPTDRGKGVLVAPTVHGNLLVGPTADFTDSKEAVNTTAQGLETVRQQAGRTIRDLPFRQVITSFAGLRSVPEGHDFVIRESAPGFIDVAGIESPGLTSAPAIGELVAGMIREKLHPGANLSFDPHRKGFVRVNELSQEDWNRLIEQDPAYGQIVCRCETVTAGEIQDACRRSIPARTMDGVKRRVRAGMGRCQGGFCSPKVLEILCEETGLSPEQIRKSGADSPLVTGRNKEEADYDR